MRLTEITVIRDFRSIERAGPIELGDVTLFVGPNNAGKSSILQAVLLLQQDFGVGGRQVRLGATSAHVSLKAGDVHGFRGWNLDWEPYRATIDIQLDPAKQIAIAVKADGTAYGVSQIAAREPDHLIVPFLSRRYPESFNEDVKEEYATRVHPNLRFLGAKLTRVAQPAHPRHLAYAEACERILGVVVTAVPSQNGQMPGAFVGTSDSIPLQDMGSGVAQVVGLLTELALAEDKIFVVEEPENDLHPEALRALLDLMVEAADKNQFLISTHSNLVLRHLGTRESSKIYYVKADRESGWPPATTIEEVPPEPAARSRVLIDLGYELRDFEFFEAWLFLEESSAESIIRDHLIPWFAPGLAGRLRTVSARGISRVTPTFEDFNRLVLFTHLEERYRDRAWVLVDGDKTGKEIVDRLRKTYAGKWSPDRFRALAEEDFERYYPPAFADRADAALEEQDKSRRRERKRALLNEVLAWIAESPDEARDEFESSAAEIVAVLEEIEDAIGRTPQPSA